MKKFILIFIFLFISGVIIGNNKMWVNDTTYAGSTCIDGYKFAWIKTRGDNGIALVQMQYSNGTTYKFLTKCKR